MPMTRAAAILLWINGLGFGIPCVPAIRNVAAGREIPLVMGFPAYGRGPFERIGIRSTLPLIAGFLLVCALEVVAGGLLWNGQRSGAILALVLLPFGMTYWWGFALPIGPLLAVASSVLIALGWRSLT